MSISPNVPSPEESFHYENTGTPRWITVLFVVLFLGVAAVAYVGHTAQSRLETDLAKQQDQNKMLSTQLDQANTRMADLKAQLEITEQKVGMTRTELAQTKSRAEAIRKEQVESDQKLTTELTQVQKESNEKIGAVEATKGKLDRATGDMGVMSGLIARNRDDLEELKRRGDRNYFEFTLTKTKTPQRVGPVQINLTKTDPKKSKYTLTVFVDDRAIEKRDKTAGEPVQFYVKGASRMAPYELVVFDVSKDRATGYLSTPKDVGAPAAPAASTAKP